MRVFLMRHAEAEPGLPDEVRPLTARGRRQARRAGGGPFAVAAAVAPRVEHSGLKRALQTAELAMRAGGVAPGRLRRLDGLAPEDDPVATARLLASCRSPRLLVGHNPHLASLLALLLGARSREVIRFRKGAMAALERTALPSRGSPYGRWRLLWFVPPDLA